VEEEREGEGMREKERSKSREQRPESTQHTAQSTEHRAEGVFTLSDVEDQKRCPDACG
jgi:hypothetical protein